MKNKFQLLQVAILWGFITLFAVALAVNAVQATIGPEHLAIHQWPFFAGIFAIGCKSLTPAIMAEAVSFVRNISRASRSTVKKTARVIVAVHIGAVRRLSALFDKTFGHEVRI